jgi:hypothetical protein
MEPLVGEVAVVQDGEVEVEAVARPVSSYRGYRRPCCVVDERARSWFLLPRLTKPSGPGGVVA